MIGGKRSLLVALWLGGALALLAGAKEQEIFLPPDCDAVTINGPGFQLRFEEIKKEFARVQDESGQVEVPRPQQADDERDDADKNGDKGASGVERDAPEEGPVSNEHLFDKVRGAAERDYGPIDDDLFEWIGARATTLMNRVERYNKEASSTRDAAKIVVDIMLLNTLVDLDNLNREELAKFRWVKAKLRKMLAEYVHAQANAGEVLEYARKLIDENKAIELKVRGSNNPGKAWITNTQALKRILHEQRYSDELSKLIVDYLAGPFNMMKRSAVYQINRRSKRMDDGLRYVFALSRVPDTFPFAAQDAISRGDI